MSTLEHIRKRPGLVITILGLALVLFIFTAISNPDKLFSDPNTIAKVDGNKITRDQMSNETENLRRQYENSEYKDRFSSDQLQEQAMYTLIQERLFDEIYDRAGISVTGDELARLMLGDRIPMAIQQIYWQRQQAGLYSGAMLHELATKPLQYQLDNESAQAYREQWIELEQYVSQMLKRQKLNSLIAGALPANDLDAMAQHDDDNNTSVIRYAKVDPSAIADSDIEISDAELRDRYNSEKENYKLDEDLYMLDYIVVNVTPSDQDRLEATQAVENALIDLRNTPGTEAVAGNHKFVVSRHNTAAKYLPANISGRLESLAQDSVQQLSFYDNKYILAKYIGSDMATDSITYDAIRLADTANVDSVLALLNAGTPVDALPEGTVAASDKDLRLSLLNGDPVAALIFGNAVENNYFIAPEYLHTDRAVFCLKSKDAPVATYNVAEISYQLEPSTTTINDTQSRLRAYVANNPDSKSFVDNAIAANYMTRSTGVTNTRITVDDLPNSSHLAKWAVNAKKGQVSDVYSDDKKSVFYTATLTDIYDNGYRPLSDTSVESQTRSSIAREKKLEKLLSQYQGKANSLDGYAQAMNARIDTTTVTFGKDNATGLFPGDGRLFALATQAEPGALNGPEATKYALIVFEVLERKAPERDFDPVADAARFQEQRMGSMMILQTLPAILRANADVDNRIQDLVQE